VLFQTHEKGKIIINPNNYIRNQKGGSRSKQFEQNISENIEKTN